MLYVFSLKGIETYLNNIAIDYLRPLYNLLTGGIVIGPTTRVSRRASIRIVAGGTIKIGSYCTIHDYAMILTCGGRITIGDRSTLNPFCVIYGHGGLKIGNGVRIGAHTVIIPGNHNYQDPDKFIYEQGMTCKGIEIQDDVWMGAGVKILDGVVVRKGSVIGSGAVVTEDVPEYAVVAGVPAKVIKYRKAP